MNEVRSISAVRFVIVDSAPAVSGLGLDGAGLLMQHAALRY